MGGNAFDTPARRIPQATYLLLSPLVLSRLSHLFTGLSTPRNFLGKADHGDLDVLCGFPETVQGGDEEWLPVEGGSYSGGEMVKLGKRLPEGERADALRGVLGEVKGALGATGWRRRGTDVSFKVPCSIMEGTAAMEETSQEEFYQIDLIIVPPASVDFITFTSSYSGTVLIIGHILRRLSPSLTLHLTHLDMRHLPFSGVPNVEVLLCDSPEGLCEWMGWDYRRWEGEGEGWVEEKELWEWVADVDLGSRAGQVLAKMVGRKTEKKEEKEGKERKEGGPQKVKRTIMVDRFYEWLQIESRWAIAKEDGSQNEQATQATSPSPSPLSAADPSPALTPSRPSTPPAETARSSALAPNPSYIDPSAPLPLDPHAVDCLAYWGQTDAYAAILAERQGVAREIAQRQAARTQRKEKARAVLAEQQAEKKRMGSSEETIIKNLGGMNV